MKTLINLITRGERDGNGTGSDLAIPVSDIVRVFVGNSYTARNHSCPSGDCIYGKRDESLPVGHVPTIKIGMKDGTIYTSDEMLLDFIDRVNGTEVASE